MTSGGLVASVQDGEDVGLPLLEGPPVVERLVERACFVVGCDIVQGSECVFLLLAGRAFAYLC